MFYAAAVLVNSWRGSKEAEHKKGAQKDVGRLGPAVAGSLKARQNSPTPSELANKHECSRASVVTEGKLSPLYEEDAHYNTMERERTHGLVEGRKAGRQNKSRPQFEMTRCSTVPP